MKEKELLIEIHQMLKKVCDYIDKIESSEYIQKEYNMQFMLNVVADMYVESLEKLRNEKDRNTDSSKDR